MFSEKRSSNFHVPIFLKNEFFKLFREREKVKIECSFMQLTGLNVAPPNFMRKSSFFSWKYVISEYIEVAT